MNFLLTPRRAAAVFLALEALTLAGGGRLRAAAAPAAGSASAAVADIQAALIDSMKAGKTITLDERIAKLTPVIERTHDMDTVCRVVLGKHWRDLKPDQQDAFRAKFKQVGIVSYAANFKTYGGERFDLIDEKANEKNKDQSLVRTEMVEAGGKKHAFDYVLSRDTKADWLIINVVVDGVSDLALKRSEYADVIDKSGFDGLLKKLDEKIAEQRKLGSE